MYIELRTPDERLRGPKAVDPAPVLASVPRAARDGSVDLARLRVVCEWIQYKNNFRDPVGVRLVEPWALEAARRNGHAHAEDALEVAIDLRRANTDHLDELVAQALAHATEDDTRVPLEDWVPGSRSLI